MDSDLNDIIDEKAVEWFIRLRADNVTLNEKIAFNHWLEEDVRHSNAFYDICIIWEDEDLLRTLKKSAQKYNIAPKPRKKTFSSCPCCFSIACRRRFVEYAKTFGGRSDFGSRGA